MLFTSGLADDTYVSALSDSEKERFADIFAAYIDALKAHRYQPCLAVAPDGSAKAFSAMPLPSFQEMPGYVVEPYTSVSALLEVYYQDKNLRTGIRKRSQELRKNAEILLERVSRKLDLQMKQLKDTEKREKIRHQGELLQAYAYQLPVGESSVRVTDWESGEEVVIATDPDLSIRDNANRYFDRYGKLKRTYAALTEQVISTQEELEELRDVLHALEIAENEDDLQEIRREMQEAGFLKMPSAKGKRGTTVRSHPYHYQSSDGFDIYVGKNNLQNDEITFHLASPNDIWMHAKNAPGSHVIIRTDGREVPDRTYEEGAALAAY